MAVASQVLPVLMAVRALRNPATQLVSYCAVMLSGSLGSASVTVRRALTVTVAPEGTRTLMVSRVGACIDQRGSGRLTVQTESPVGSAIVVRPAGLITEVVAKPAGSVTTRRVEPVLRPVTP